jgi:hypothetical protein
MLNVQKLFFRIIQQGKLSVTDHRLSRLFRGFSVAGALKEDDDDDLSHDEDEIPLTAVTTGLNFLVKFPILIS